MRDKKTRIKVIKSQFILVLFALLFSLFSADKIIILSMLYGGLLALLNSYILIYGFNMAIVFNNSKHSLKLVYLVAGLKFLIIGFLLALGLILGLNAILLISVFIFLQFIQLINFK